MGRTEFDSGAGRAAARVLGALLPVAERDEVLGDLAEEHARRARGGGQRRADAWLWRQVLGSLPALLGRTWWRGSRGFEPEANRMQPGGPMLESLIMDVRYSARRLMRRPLYTALAVLTLALGVGGAGAIFTIVKNLLLDGLPYGESEELVQFWFPLSWSEQEFLSLREEFTGFRDVAAYRPEMVTLQPGSEAARLVPGTSSSGELFDVLGVRPALGRGLQPSDDVMGAEPVAVISWGLWRELGGDASVIGSRILMDGTPRAVVGVMPRGFWFPDPSTRIWLAESLNPENGSGNYALVGRMNPGMSVASMAGPLSSLTRTLGERFQYPEQWDKTKNAELTPLRDAISGPVRPALLATLAALAAILLMACANVAALMLGQVDGRSGELALRTALGAGRARVMQQLAAEALLLGLLAGVAGSIVALIGFPVLLRSLPLGALAEGATVGWEIVAASIVISVGAAVLVALVPLVAVWRGHLRTAMGTARTVAERGGRLESGLVVAEVALAVLMATGAALLIRSVGNLSEIDPGLDPKNLAIVDVALPGNATPAERIAKINELVPSLSAIPGVASAAAASPLPLRCACSNWGIAIVSKPDLAESTTFFRTATTDYLQTLGVELKQGRLFQEADRAGAPVIVINEALAEKYFPGENPIGQAILGNGTGEPATVIGVVENVAEGLLADDPAPARYVLYDHVGWTGEANSFVLRLRPGIDPASVFEQARDVLRSVAPGSAVQTTTTMEQVVAESMGPVRQVMILLSLLAGLALVLGAVGVYGVIAHFVARQRRDIGIRMALGLRPAQVLGGVVGRGGALVGIGIVTGLIASFFLVRIVASLLYGVGSSDPTALVAAAAVLLLTGIAAAAIPAWRASRLDPARVLRD